MSDRLITVFKVCISVLRHAYSGQEQEENVGRYFCIHLCRKKPSRYPRLVHVVILLSLVSGISRVKSIAVFPELFKLLRLRIFTKFVFNNFLL
jgi:hypothetical protein